MSLGYTFAKSSDGKWYKEPLLKGKTEDGKKWYLCFDEDDPPELVVQTTNNNGKEIDAAKILRGAGVKFSRISKNGVSGRMIGRACSFWVTITEPIPTPHKHDGVFDQPSEMGTYLFTTRKELQCLRGR